MDGREILNFNTNWLYSPMDYSNGQLMLLDDSGFERVSVPHANTVLDKHKGDDFQTQIEKYRFVSWYRRHFTLDESYSGKRLILEFEGVATVADVYVNGSYVGEHKGAYTGFSFDITDFVKLGADNVLAVRVDSARHADVPPEGGQVDYCLFGGIVRDVRLTVVNPAYISGAFLTTLGLNAEGGAVSSAVSVRNTSGEKKVLSVETVIYDMDGTEAARVASNEISVQEGGSFTVDTPVIKNPHLWSVDDPYLYTAKVSLIENGKAVDSIEVKIGLRWFEFTDTGFYLNGEKLVLRGINRHEQWPWQGRAIPDKLQIKDAELIKDTGFNAVRCSHYPQDPSFLSRCDELGLIVFEEAPGWQFVGDAEWKEVYKSNLEEMILRDRNHASIVTWGVRVNESWDDSGFVTESNALAKALDPTRPTHGVRRSENYDSTEMIEDIFCANYIYPENPRLKPFISSEHSWEHWTDGYGLPWASDAQAMEFTKSFADVVDYYYRNDYCLGGFAWSMFDYDNEVNYTNTGHVFYSGMYDIFRHDKPVAHFYRAQKEPSEAVELYIANYWTNTSPTAVEVYSNCDQVELLLNGRSLGKIEPNLYMNVPHPAFRFDNVTFAAGTLTAIGYIDGAEAARTERRTPGAAAKIVVTPDFDELTADGADMTSVTVELQDENGTRLPYADEEVTISLDGPADFIGEKVIALEGGRASFIVKSRYHETGDVKCAVTAEGVASGSCEISVGAYNDENTVPCSESFGTAKPRSIEEVNDTDFRFEYSAGWLYCEQVNCYGWDNTYADAANETVTFTFTGEKALWYGSKAPAHGIMAVSVDGGPESLVDCWAAARQDNVLLYSTGVLSYGQHKLTVRVTGSRNAQATGSYINADHVTIYSDGGAVGENVLASAQWEPDGSTWSENGGLTQNDPAVNRDYTALLDCPADMTLRATVPVPTLNDTGFGLLGRVVDDSHFYQFELKNENGGLTWNIWRCSGWDWILLASGGLEAPGDEMTLRMDIRGGEISAYALYGDGWQPLGACFDSSYPDGRAGIRTHNTAGKFTDITVFSLKQTPSEGCALKDVTVKDGMTAALRFSCGAGNSVIAARYGQDGGLEKCVRCETDESGTARPVGLSAANGVKLFVWKSPDSMIPLCEPIEI